NKALHFERVALPVPVALHRAGTPGGFNIDIPEDHPPVDADRGNVGDVDRVLAAADQARRVMDDGGRRDLDLRGKEVVSGTQSAGAEDVPRRERLSLSPDDYDQDEDDRQNRHRGDNPGRVEVELICHVSAVRLARAAFARPPWGDPGLAAGR